MALRFPYNCAETFPSLINYNTTYPMIHLYVSTARRPVFHQILVTILNSKSATWLGMDLQGTYTLCESESSRLTLPKTSWSNKHLIHFPIYVSRYPSLNKFEVSHAKRGTMSNSTPQVFLGSPYPVIMASLQFPVHRRVLYLGGPTLGGFAVHLEPDTISLRTETGLV